MKNNLQTLLPFYILFGMLRHILLVSSHKQFEIYIFFFFCISDSLLVTSYCHAVRLLKLWMRQDGRPLVVTESLSHSFVLSGVQCSSLRTGLLPLPPLSDYKKREIKQFCISDNNFSKADIHCNFFFLICLISLNRTDLLVTSALILGDKSQLALHVLQLWQVDGRTGQLHRSWQCLLLLRRLSTRVCDVCWWSLEWRKKKIYVV